MVLDASKIPVIEQLLLFEKNIITGLPAEPHTPYFKSNNIVRRTLAILLAYNSSKKEFQLVGVDNNNRLSIKGEIASTNGASNGTLTFLRTDAGGRILTNSEEDIKEDLLLLDNLTVEASAVATHGGVDVGMYTKKTLLVETNRSMTVSMQGSTDDINYYDIKTVADADVTHNCANEKILIDIPFYTHFFRVVVQNSAGAAGTVTARLMSHA